MHLIAFIICCDPLVTLKSQLGLEKQPRFLDPVTVLTATNLSFITRCVAHRSYTVFTS